MIAAPTRAAGSSEDVYTEGVLFRGGGKGKGKGGSSQVPFDLFSLTRRGTKDRRSGRVFSHMPRMVALPVR